MDNVIKRTFTIGLDQLMKNKWANLKSVGFTLVALIMLLTSACQTTPKNKEVSLSTEAPDGQLKCGDHPQCLSYLSKSQAIEAYYESSAEHNKPTKWMCNELVRADFMERCASLYDELGDSSCAGQLRTLSASVAKVEEQRNIASAALADAKKAVGETVEQATPSDQCISLDDEL